MDRLLIGPQRRLEYLCMESDRKKALPADIGPLCGRRPPHISGWEELVILKHDSRSKAGLYLALQSIGRQTGGCETGVCYRTARPETPAAGGHIHRYQGHPLAGLQALYPCPLRKL